MKSVECFMCHLLICSFLNNFISGLNFSLTPFMVDTRGALDPGWADSRQFHSALPWFLLSPWFGSPWGFVAVGALNMWNITELQTYSQAWEFVWIWNRWNKQLSAETAAGVSMLILFSVGGSHLYLMPFLFPAWITVSAGIPTGGQRLHRWFQCSLEVSLCSLLPCCV